MKTKTSERLIHKALVFIAVLFGVITSIAGVRVLAGGDPGYVVFRPLLIYNAIMGLAYVAAGILAWRSLVLGRHSAGAIFGLNLVVLGIIVYLYLAGTAVAINSVRAMTLRTVVWLVLFIGLAWLSRRRALADAARNNKSPSRPPDAAT